MHYKNSQQKVTCEFNGMVTIPDLKQKNSYMQTTIPQ